MKNEMLFEQRIKNYSKISKSIEISKNKIKKMLNVLSHVKIKSEKERLEQECHDELYKILTTEIHPTCRNHLKFIFDTTDVSKAWEKLSWHFKFSRDEVEEIFNQNKGKDNDLREITSDKVKYDFMRWHCYYITNNPKYLDDTIFSLKRCKKIFKGLNIHHIKNTHIDEYDDSFSICICSSEQHNKFHKKFGKKSINDLLKMGENKLTKELIVYVKIIKCICLSSDDYEIKKKNFLCFINKMCETDYTKKLNNLVKDV